MWPPASLLRQMATATRRKPRVLEARARHRFCYAARPCSGPSCAPSARRTGRPAHRRLLPSLPGRGRGAGGRPPSLHRYGGARPRGASRRPAAGRQRRPPRPRSLDRRAHRARARRAHASRASRGARARAFRDFLHRFPAGAFALPSSTRPTWPGSVPHSACPWWCTSTTARRPPTDRRAWCCRGSSCAPRAA